VSVSPLQGVSESVAGDAGPPSPRLRRTGRRLL